ncbi:hypothetical protein AVEN_218043-1 [Araneus ventricosus]|uniref:Uncharacterized protein n=1 Tax=Araneus ventricosus TaxID=182803 RepID=A0A4Y2N3L2_ARAVE|nr:hypothetical protein AVEN_218043-1 [Araneus ventricosus]
MSQTETHICGARPEGVKATRQLFWDGFRNFEPLSDDEDDTRDGIPSPNFRTKPVGGCLVPYLRFNVKQAHKHCGSPAESVSNLELSGPEAETLPLGHRGLTTSWKPPI